MNSRISRRRFVTGAAAASLLAGCDSRPIASFLRAMKDWNAGFEAALFSPSRLAPELPESATTPEADFPEYYISDEAPDVPPNWFLTVGGLVERPRRFMLAELQAMTQTSMRVRHHCVEGWSAVASWQGLRVSDLARAAGLKQDVRYVEFRSFDSGYWSCWDLASAMHPQTLLAWGMNGHPLTSGHGAPLRVYSAVKLGYKMCKYLAEVNFLALDSGGYWENQGYDWFAGV